MNHWRSLALASFPFVLALGCSSSSSSPLAELPAPDASPAAAADAGGSSEGDASPPPAPDAGELADAGAPDAAKDAPAAGDGGTMADAGELDAGADAGPPVDAGPAVEWFCDVSAKNGGTPYDYPMCPPYGSSGGQYPAEQMACGDHSASLGDASIPDAGAPVCPTSSAMPCPTPHCSAYINGGGPAYWYAGGLVHK